MVDFRGLIENLAGSKSFPFSLPVKDLPVRSRLWNFCPYVWFPRRACFRLPSPPIEFGVD